ncbi:hypothetical protein COL41_29270 [Bacillus mycoides]|uniref:hypothetical protein n=1 Tax=Bacillus mycoides TaxID=1405 RepID=UPI000BF9EBCE|nr:hypothetical protein [Bacillus mycoides]PFX88250.1 hypothetical protein COL41_29270 [Bacillus mycoides]QWH79136.1 hypothetical protein EXW59_21585 [Bacillus mycoides]QWI44184.1 hypothetical protein EXW55_14840 [Bacillus mycoides]
MKGKWIENITIYHTALSLKMDHKILGKSKTLWCVTTFANDLQTGTPKYIVTKPIYIEGEVFAGNIIYALTKEELIEFFIPMEKEVIEYLEEREAHKEWVKDMSM